MNGKLDVMTEQPIYSKSEFLAIFRSAKERKRIWQEKAMKELAELQQQMEQEKKEHNMSIKAL